MLAGETAPDTTSGTAGDMARTGRQPSIIDAKAEIIEARTIAETIAETDRPRLSPALSAQPQMPRGSLHRAKGRSGPGPRGLTQRAPRSAPDLPEGARFLEGSFSNSAGSRAYKLYIPSRCQGQPLPLVVMLHGCTQSPDDFAAGTRMNAAAEQQPCLVAYPVQHSQANPAISNPDASELLKEDFADLKIPAISW